MACARGPRPQYAPHAHRRNPETGIMLRLLFPRLTAARGDKLFDALVGEARQVHWFTDGKVPDTLDGRFAVLATVLALAMVRLDRGGQAARDLSVGLAEHFVDAMDAEHRQMGVSDPGLGKKVRKLVSLLGRRVEEWRRAVANEADWQDTTAASLYGGDAAFAPAGHSARALRELWRRLDGASDAALVEGIFG